MPEFRPRYTRATFLPTDLTVGQVIHNAMERLARDPRGKVIVIVNGAREQRDMDHFDEATHRRVPVLAAGERVEYHIDGTTHVVAE